MSVTQTALPSDRTAELAATLHPVSVVILTYNEEDNIDRCLASVDWCDDVVVIDSGSKDRTREFAERRGARVLVRPFDDFAQQRNFATEHGGLQNAWVLHIDADEEVSPELKAEILSILSAPAAAAPAYLVPERLVLHGRWLRHAGMYPRYQARFGRSDSLRFQMHGHGQRETLPASLLGRMHGALIHHNFSKGMAEWFGKHARYARQEAAAEIALAAPVSLGSLCSRDATTRRRALKNLSVHLPLRPLMRFVYVGLVRRGFLDGVVGWRYAAMMAVYQWMIDLNRMELRSAQPADAVLTKELP